MFNDTDATDDTDSGADRTAIDTDTGADRTANERTGADRTAGSSHTGADRTADSVERRIDELVADVASGWDNDQRLDPRREACRAALHRLYREGELSKATATSEVEPDHPVDGQTAETWWRQNVRDAIKNVADCSRGQHAYVLDHDEPRPEQTE